MKTFSLTVKDEHKLGVVENEVLQNILGAKRN